MKVAPTKGDKREIREKTHLTRPPRLESVVREAKMLPVPKKRRAGKKPSAARKPRGITEQQRKDYQLRSMRH